MVCHSFLSPNTSTFALCGYSPTILHTMYIKQVGSAENGMPGRRSIGILERCPVRQRFSAAGTYQVVLRGNLW